MLHFLCKWIRKNGQIRKYVSYGVCINELVHDVKIARIDIFMQHVAVCYLEVHVKT